MTSRRFIYIALLVLLIGFGLLWYLNAISWKKEYVKKEEIKKISRNLGIEISIKCYPLKTFEKNVNHDIFLKEVLKSHIVFKNTELFIQKVLKNG